MKGIGTAAKWGAGLALAAGTAALAVVGLAVNVGEDLQKALNGLQSETGTTDKAMTGMKDSMLAIYNNNFGESFEDIGKAMATVSQATGLTGKALEDATTNALMLRDTFEMDVDGSIVAVDQLMKQFGLTSDESYNLLAQGAQKGMNSQGDLVDIVKEYSGQFKTMGFNSTEMFNMLSNGAKEGGFSIDVMGDAMKEFNIRSKDGSKASAEAFTSLGLNSDKLTKSFAKGGTEGKKAFSDVMEKLSGMKDPMAQNQAGVALFGTMWEDLGPKAILALGNTKGGIDLTKDALAGINAVKYNTFGEAMEGMKRNITTGILLPISEKVLPILSKFSTWVIENMPAIKSKVEVAMGYIGIAFDNIKVAVDIAVDVFKVLIDSLKSISTWVTENQTLVETIAIVVGSFALAWGAVNLALGIWAVVGAIATGVTTAFGVAVAFLTSPIGLVILAIAAIIAVGILLYKNWDEIKTFMLNLWETLKTKATEIFAAIWNTIKNAFSATVDWFKNIFTSAWNGIKAVFVAVGGFFSGVWNGIKSVFSGIDSWFRNIFQGAWTAIKGVFNGVGSFFGGLWNTIKSKFTTIGSAIGNAIGGAFKTVVNSIIRFAENTINGFIRAINGALSMINKIPGVSIGSVSSLNIPKLAKGGIVDKGQIYQANEDGREVIMPLEKNLGWIDNLASKLSDKSNNSNSSEPKNIIIQLIADGKKLAEIVAPYSDVIQGKNIVMNGRSVGI